MSAIVLMNGSESVRVRNSEGCTVLECGCAFTDVLWLQMCLADHAAYAELHRSAAIDHQSTHEEK